jgi:hypothetical protein
MSTIILEFDDLEANKPGLDEVIRLKEHYPTLKVTFFMVPIPQSLLAKDLKLVDYRKWSDWVKAQDWIEVCPHGMTHAGFEMKYATNNRGREVLVDYDLANIYLDAVEHTFKELDLPYQKVWKSPHWETSPDALKAIWDRGYVIACDPNQPVPEGGPVYLYDWSIDTPYPKGQEIVKAHGHMYPPSSNAIGYSWRTVLQMPQDAEFKFVSEVL